MKHIHTFVRSQHSLREARLCFDAEGNPDVSNQASQSPEAQEKRHLEAIHKAMTDIAQMTLPPNGQVNATAVRNALQAAGKSAQEAQKNGNSSLATRLATLQKQATDLPGFLGVLLALQSTQPTVTVTLTAQQQKQIGQLAATISPTALNVETKQNLDAQNKRKKLRAELAKLTADVERTNTIAKSKKQQEELKSKQLALQTLLRNTDPALLKEIGDEIGVENFQKQLEDLASTTQGQEAIKRLTTGLNALNSGVGFEQYTSVEGIMKMSRDIVDSELARSILDAARERGINIPSETAIRILFVAIRGVAASAFATFRIFNSFPELREKGRQFHYRIALEAQLRSQGNAALSLTSMVTQSTEQLELLALGQNPDAIKKRWFDMYEAWRTIAQRNRQSSMSAAIPAMPTIAQAMNEKQSKDYIAAVNGTPIPQTEVASPLPRSIDSLIFNPPAFTLEVRADQPLSVTVNGTRMDFTKDNSNVIQVRTAGRTIPIRFGTIGGTAITRLTLFAPTANAGDIQVRLNENTTQPSFTLGTLVDQARTHPNNNTINLTNPTTLAFA